MGTSNLLLAHVTNSVTAQVFGFWGVEHVAFRTQMGFGTHFVFFMGIIAFSGIQPPVALSTFHTLPFNDTARVSITQCANDAPLVTTGDVVASVTLVTKPSGTKGPCYIGDGVKMTRDSVIKRVPLIHNVNSALSSLCIIADIYWLLMRPCGEYYHLRVGSFFKCRYVCKSRGVIESETYGKQE
jgi:hypothetical protein